ncbi:MAG: hypothetical protein ACFFDT_26190 [Candidatus Hodarchaeota archaeon]
MPKKNAEKWILEVDSREDLISHLVILEDDEITGYCFALPNSFNKNIIATFYIDAMNEDYLKQLITKTIEKCIQKKRQILLIDLLKDLLRYEKPIKSLGFKQAAVFGIYEKIMF